MNKEFIPPLKIRFVKRSHEYDDVYTYVFRPKEKLMFAAGQNARIVIPCVDSSAPRACLTRAQHICSLHGRTTSGSVLASQSVHPEHHRQHGSDPARLVRESQGSGSVMAARCVERVLCALAVLVPIRAKPVAPCGGQHLGGHFPVISAARWSSVKPVHRILADPTIFLERYIVLLTELCDLPHGIVLALKLRGE